MEGLKFEHLDIINFKNIDRKVVDIGGRSFIIMAKNGSGKSSLIQAMLSPLSAKFEPEIPVKNGEEKGRIEVVLAGTLSGISKRYTMEVYFSAKDNKGKLTLLNESNEKISAPKTFLKELIGGISFDVMQFINSTKAEKIKILRELSGAEKEIYAADHKIKECSENKTFLERKAKELESFISVHDLTQEHIKKYEKEINVEEMNLRLTEVNKSNENYNKVKAGVLERENMVKIRDNSINAKKEKIEKLKAEIEALNVEIEGLEAQNESNRSDIQKGNEWLAKAEYTDPQTIIDQINDALRHNSEVQKIAEVAKKHAEMQDIQSKITMAEAAVKKAKENRDKVIAASNLPVKGLTWTDSEVFIDGLPLEETQVNKSRILEIGLDMAIAMNPKLKAIFLHDGSLFDKDHLQHVINKVESAGYQLIVECVGENTDLNIEFVEATV